MVKILKGQTEKTQRIPEGAPPAYPDRAERLDSSYPLMAGPWVGEFGWELFGWQAYIRRIAPKFPEVTIACKEGMQYLYQDFADRIILYNIEEPGTGGWICKGLDKIPDPRGEVEDTHAYLHPYFKIGYYLSRPSKSHPGFFKQKFIPLGEDSDTEYDIAIHARATGKNHSAKRNIWGERDWVRFVKKFEDNSMVAVGSKSDALCPEGVTDMRDKPLSESATVIRSSRCMVGPSSGPMHLAALCETPIAVFTADSNNKSRYKKYWNPFNIKVKYIGMDDWDANVARRVDRYVKALLY